MYRRDMLKAATLSGAVLLTASSERATAATRRENTRASRRGSHIETRDGTQLFYRDWGQGSPVVFLSGWSLPSDSWNYQLAPLSETGLRCIAYDRRGHGRSSDPGRGFDYDSLADDFADVLEALDLRDVTVVAHSMAGGEAVRYLTRHGARRIARLVLVGATLPFLIKTADNPDGIDSAVFEHLRRNTLLKDFPKALHDNLRPFVVPETSDAMVSWIGGLMLRCSMKAALECNRSLTATDFRAELPKISVPTLLVHGDRDVSAPVDLTGRRVAKLMPNAQLKVYEGAPHGLMLTHMDRLNRDLAEFIRG